MLPSKTIKNRSAGSAGRYCDGAHWHRAVSGGSNADYIIIRGNQPGPFFLTLANVPLTKQEFVTELRKVPLAVGLPAEEYMGHSSGRCGGLHYPDARTVAEHDLSRLH